MNKKVVISLFLAILLPLSTSAHLVSEQFCVDDQKEFAVHIELELHLQNVHQQMDQALETFDHHDSSPDCCGAVCAAVSAQAQTIGKPSHSSAFPISNPNNALGYIKPLFRPPIS